MQRPSPGPRVGHPPPGHHSACGHLVTSTETEAQKRQVIGGVAERSARRGTPSSSPGVRPRARPGGRPYGSPRGWAGGWRVGRGSRARSRRAGPRARLSRGRGVLGRGRAPVFVAPCQLHCNKSGVAAAPVCTTGPPAPAVADMEPVASNNVCCKGEFWSAAREVRKNLGRTPGGDSC